MGQPILKRPKLERFLGDMLENYPILSVVAGMGYGKTETIRSMLKGMDAVIAWVRLTEYDNNPVHFWNNFTQAMVPYNAPEVVGFLRSTGMPDGPAQFERYLEFPDAMIVPGKRYIFVYDDLQLIHSPSVLWFLEKSISAPYKMVRSILLSQSEPAFSSMRSKASVLRISEEELSFTWEETRDFLLLRGLNLPDESLDLIFKETAGCPAALQLIGSFLQESPYFSERRALSAMRASLEGIFEGEIFSRISPELSLALEKLALIETPTLALLHETGIVHETIEKEMKGLSAVLRRNCSSDAYRIHPLFLDCLRRRKSSLDAA
ncbi:MAG: hypothetical protein LBU47_05885, partial [Christensenellaceae bacterium]|nr:hypothetical protein [Christensenellaceae bacterium]